MPMTRKCCLVDRLTGEVLATYGSIAEAERATGVSRWHVYGRGKGWRTLRYAEEAGQPLRHDVNAPVAAYDGTVAVAFAGIAEAAEALHVSKAWLWDRIKLRQPLEFGGRQVAVARIEQARPEYAERFRRWE